MKYEAVIGKYCMTISLVLLSPYYQCDIFSNEGSLIHLKLNYSSIISSIMTDNNIHLGLPNTKMNSKHEL